MTDSQLYLATSVGDSASGQPLIAFCCIGVAAVL
jgi:hypothetical protein